LCGGLEVGGWRLVTSGPSASGWQWGVSITASPGFSAGGRAADEIACKANVATAFRKMLAHADLRPIRFWAGRPDGSRLICCVGGVLPKSWCSRPLVQRAALTAGTPPAAGIIQHSDAENSLYKRQVNSTLGTVSQRMRSVLP
jgi:hypothetical protein